MVVTAVSIICTGIDSLAATSTVDFYFMFLHGIGCDVYTLASIAETNKTTERDFLANLEE